jgi:hypothetical protein
LDELLIVNPGPVPEGELLIGDDGSLYQVQGRCRLPGVSKPAPNQGLGECLLGADGRLYRRIQ